MDEQASTSSADSGYSDCQNDGSIETAALKNVALASLNPPYKVVRFESVTERERSIGKMQLGGRSPTKMPTQLIHPADDDESGTHSSLETLKHVQILDL